MPAALAAVFLAVGPLSAGALPAYAQDDLSAQNCSNIVKNIVASEGSTITLNIAGADCSAGDAKLRVTYFWLDDLATGHILSGYLPPTLRQALGRDYPVIQNDVFGQVKSLYERFAIEHDVSTQEEMRVSTCFATGERDAFGDIVNCAEGDPDTYRSERRSQTAGGVKRLPLLNFFVPLMDEENVLANTRGWPEGYEFYYGWDGDADQIMAASSAGEPIAIPSLRLWRPARVSDIRGLRQRLRTYVDNFVAGEAAGFDIVGFPWGTAPSSRAERQSAVSNFLPRYTNELREARFLEFISRNVDITNLAYVYGTNATCGDSWQFRLAGPEFKLLIAVVENAGDRPISVDRLDVLSSERTELRQIPTTNTTPGEGWREASIRLPRPVFRPGDGVLVPMRIEFRSEPEGTFQPSDGAAYEEIQALPPDTPLFFPGTDVAKAAGSFRPHSERPKRAVFAYGPEIRLEEARAENRQIALRQVDPTAISLYVGFEVGSCPFVYGFDRGNDTWRLQSRAVVGATNRGLAYEDRFQLEHFDGRLKIAELEPEVSFLDDMVVDVTLADGAVRRLLPDDPRLEYRDGSEFVITYPDMAEIGFPGFADIDGAVVSAEVRVFGYYREFGVQLRTVSTRVQGPICDFPRRRM